MSVTKKTSGMTYTFNPDTKTWSGPYDLRPASERVFCSTIGFSGNNLILAGVIRLDREVKGVKLWRVEDWEAKGVVMCEFGDGGACEWGSVRNAAWNDKSNITDRVVLSCGRVEIGDLQKAFKLPNVKLVAKLSA
ncbi:hypothetical protein Ancab_003816 [Ancistrocladus abbreviatus]